MPPRTWFDADRRVCIGRRKLPAGPWEVVRLEDHRFKTNDSHNTAVLGICDTDGTIHMAFDHHASQLNSRISKPGAAHHPETVNWDTSLFSGVLHTLGSVTPDKSFTYPRFFPAANGKTSCYGEALLDLQRWDSEKVLSIYSQQKPARAVQTQQSKPIDGSPSPLHVVDYRFKKASVSSSQPPL